MTTEICWLKLSTTVSAFITSGVYENNQLRCKVRGLRCGLLILKQLYASPNCNLMRGRQLGEPVGLAWLWGNQSSLESKPALPVNLLISRLLINLIIITIRTCVFRLRLFAGKNNGLLRLQMIISAYTLWRESSGSGETEMSYNYTCKHNHYIII